MTEVTSTNPAQNYAINGRITASPHEGIIRKVNQANQARESWRRLGISKRVELLRQLYDHLKQHGDDIASTITKEVGTPIAECNDEVNWDWSYFSWFLDNAVQMLAPETTGEDDTSLYQITYEPTGSVAVITPWNLPFDMFVWGVIPNLLVGNTVIYKAAEECALTGKLLEELCGEAGLPEDVLSFIHGTGEQGAFLARQNVDMVWFTGSSEVGKQLYELAGKRFIKAVIETGGSNPAIIFEDADLDIVVPKIMFKRYSFAGQTCDAVKRLIVHEDIYDQLINRLQTEVAKIVVGNPDNTATTMGPLVSKKQLDTLATQVEISVKAGARIITGGKQPEDLEGAYFLPTILTDVTPTMPVWREEVFGPVLPIMKFSSEEEAIKLANDTRYGLGSQVYTRNGAKALRVASELKVGGVDINGTSHFKPFNPFGGYKDSGMGREHGVYGIRELCQLKLISRPKNI